MYPLTIVCISMMTQDGESSLVHNALVAAKIQVVRCQTDPDGLGVLVSLGRSADDDVAERFPPLPCKVNLDWSFSKISKKGISAIARSNKSTVVGFKLAFTEVGDAELRELAHFDKLQSIDLHGTKITDKGLALLAKEGKSALAALTLSSTEIGDLGLNSVATFEHLTFLDLRNTKITSARCKPVAGLRHLKSLRISGDVGGFDSWADAGSLEELQCFGSDISKKGFESIGRLPRLRKLYLTETKIDASGIDAVTFNSKLETFSVHGSATLSRPELAHLTALKNLRSLSLVRCELDDAAIGPLENLNVSEELCLCFNKITDAGVTRIAKMNNLARLDLSGNKLTGQSLNSLISLVKLERLDLSFNPLADEGFGAIRGLRSLREIGLSRTQLTDISVKSLGRLTLQRR